MNLFLFHKVVKKLNSLSLVQDKNLDSVLILRVKWRPCLMFIWILMSVISWHLYGLGLIPLFFNLWILRFFLLGNRKSNLLCLSTCYTSLPNLISLLGCGNSPFLTTISLMYISLFFDLLWEDYVHQALICLSRFLETIRHHFIVVNTRVH